MSNTKILFPTFAVKAQEQTKENLINNFIRYMLSRTQSMFIYDGLPKTIPAKWLEFYLQTNGEYLQYILIILYTQELVYCQ